MLNPHGQLATPAPTLPPGHPSVADPDDEEDSDNSDSDEELPPGHPPLGGAPAPASAPAAASPATAQARLPEDQSDVDPALPAGVIVVEVRDAADQPIPRADVTLGILQQSVAKGDSRKRAGRQADPTGTVRFEGMETGTGVAYRVTVPWGGEGAGDQATYAAPPFQLDLHRGQHVRLHVYPVTYNINEAVLGMEGILYIELKDDALQFDEFFRVYNLGAVTWVPNQVTIALPHGYKAFSSQREMSDTGFDEAPGVGAKMRGTFAPGRHDTHFRYQIPYDATESVELSLTLPPHVADMRVIAEASRDMTLQVDGFPKAMLDRNQRGQRVLVSDRKLRAGEQPLSRVRIVLDNIPTEGQAKWITTALAAATIALGLYFAFQQEGSWKKKPNDPLDTERARARLVAEIGALERARATGEVGPKAYVRIHDALVDSLARIMAVGEG